MSLAAIACMLFFPTDFLDLTIPKTEETNIENSYYLSRVAEHYQTFKYTNLLIVTGWVNSMSPCFSAASHMMRIRWASANRRKLGDLMIFGYIRLWEENTVLCNPKGLLLPTPLHSCTLKCEFFLSYPNILLLLSFETSVSFSLLF